MKHLLRTFLFVSLGIAVVGVGHSGAALNSGDLIVVDFASGGGGSVIIVDPVTGFQTLLSTGGFFVNPFGIAVDATSRIFVADGDAGFLIEVDNTSGLQTIIAAMPRPISVAVGLGDDLWVADLGGGAAPPAVYTVNKNTSVVSLVVSGAPFVTPLDIALNKFATPYVVDRNAGGSGKVFEIPAMTVISEGQNFIRPHGIAIDQGAPFFPANEPGGIYVVDVTSDAAIFVDVNLPSPTNQTVQSVGQNFSFPGGISIGAWPVFPSPFYVADYGSKAIIEYDPTQVATGNQTIISAGGLFVGPVRLSVVPEQPVQVENETWGGIKGLYR
jgi:hypothetical protein